LRAIAVRRRLKLPGWERLARAPLLTSPRNHGTPPSGRPAGPRHHGAAPLDEAACLLPALVAQLEQAIGAGALTPAVIPNVG